MGHWSWVMGHCCIVAMTISLAVAQEAPPPLPAAVIECVSTPPGARIYVGHPRSRRGEFFKGFTPAAVTIESSQSVPLDYRITFVKPGYDDWATVVQVTRGDRIRLACELETSSKVAYFAARSLMVMGYNGSHRRTVATLDADSPPSRPCWSPDGRLVAFANRGEIWAAGSRGLPLQQLSDVGKTLGATGMPPGGWTCSSPAWSPDGRWIAFRLRRGGPPSPPPLPDSEESDLLCLISGEVAEYGADEGLVRSPPRRTATAAEPLVVGSGARAFSWSPEGQRLAVQEDTSLRILVISDDGGAMPRTVIPEASEPAWAPDGSRLAYVSGGQILLHEMEGGRTTELTGPGTGPARNPCWSPDGQRIAYLGPRAEGPDRTPGGSDLGNEKGIVLHIKSLGGSPEEVILPVPDGNAAVALEGFTPDGLGVAVHRGPDSDRPALGPVQGPIWVVRADGSPPTEWIPNGGLLAISSSLPVARSGNLELFRDMVRAALADDDVETLSLLTLDPLWAGPVGSQSKPQTGEQRWAALQTLADGVDEELAEAMTVEPAASEELPSEAVKAPAAASAKEDRRSLVFPGTDWRVGIVRGKDGWRIAEVGWP